MNDKEKLICKLLLQYIFITGSVDKLDLQSIYQYLQRNDAHEIKKIFKDVSLTAALEYFLIEYYRTGEHNYNLEETRLLLQYIKSNEEKINAIIGNTSKREDMPEDNVPPWLRELVWMGVIMVLTVLICDAINNHL